MVKIDVTFDEKTMSIFQNFIGKKLKNIKQTLLYILLLYMEYWAYILINLYIK